MTWFWIIYAILTPLVFWFMCCLYAENHGVKYLFECDMDTANTLIVFGFWAWPVTAPLATYIMFKKTWHKKLSSPMRWLVRELLNPKTNVKDAK